MADGGASSGPVHRVIYRSHSLIPAAERRAALAEIFSEARSNNKRAGITGALLITDHYFAQTLEGDEAAVTALYDRISKDERHDRVTLMESGPEDARVFSRWAMAQISASGHADIPLHAAEGGIHASAPSPVTREQSAVLKIMRNAIGADTV